MDIIRNNIRRLSDLVHYLKRFRQRHDLRLVKNKNTLAKIYEDDSYQRLRQEYADMIRDGVQNTGAPAPGNKVWICWLQGEESAPPLVKACIHSVRQNLPQKEVIVLSEETIPQYVHFPEHITRKWKEKKFSAAHYSDLLRVSLLCEYGGMWIDATVLCTSPQIPRAITDSPLFVYQIIDLTRQDENGIIASSWFISAWSEQRILLLTRELLYEYWRRADHIENYFLFHLFFAMAARRYPEDWARVPVFNNQSPHTLQFELQAPYRRDRWDDILNMSVFHKLNRRFAPEAPGDTFYDHILRSYAPER